jgi:hypothetical protein
MEEKTGTGMKRGRGRPPGSRDSRPRQFRSKMLLAQIHGQGQSVEDQIKALTRPARISTLSMISGLSEASLRKKIEQGKIKAFRRSGIVLVEPQDFLEYWRDGLTGGTRYNPR